MVCSQAADARSARREPIGKYFVQICTTTLCILRGGNEILKTVQQHLGGLHVGDTAKDVKFTAVEVECLGACSNMPMLAVNDDFYVCSTVAVPYYSYMYPFRRTRLKRRRGKSWMVSRTVRNLSQVLKADDSQVKTLLG